MPKKRIFRPVLLLLLSGLSGLLTRPAPGAEILVSAASSLTNAFAEAGPAFEARNPGQKVAFNFAASGTLLQQIEKGAPVDVFASADGESMDRAQQRGRVASGTRREFARNHLVVVVPAASRLALAGLRDLQRGEAKRIALGDPGFVPAGKYARRALERAALWAKLEPKLIFGNNVRQVLDYVQRGEVDAGFVFETDAVLRRQKVRTLFRAEGQDPILYPIAVMADSRRQELARRFIDFLCGTEGRTILRRHGFGNP